MEKETQLDLPVEESLRVKAMLDAIELKARVVEGQAMGYRLAAETFKKMFVEFVQANTRTESVATSTLVNSDNGV